MGEGQETSHAGALGKHQSNPIVSGISMRD
jgi:hypothetical protein